jgi:HK97 family phage prohead protease
MNKIIFTGDLAKVDSEQRIVAGHASTEAIDAAGEIVLKSALTDALDGYLKFPAVREMHQPSAVGTVKEAKLDSKGLYIVAKIVDDSAWTKVKAGVYRAWSIGGKVLGRDKKNEKIITKIRLDEISLVDRPSNPEAKIDLWKASGPTIADALAGMSHEERSTILTKAALKLPISTAKWGL